MTTIGGIVALLAGLLHAYIFMMESLWWTRPAIWRRFGLSDQAQAETTKSLAYNQGFYNLFLGIGAAIGAVLLWTGQQTVGRTLAIFACSCMVAAALVLLTTGKSYLRAAVTQGALPLVAVALLVAA